MANMQIDFRKQWFWLLVNLAAALPLLLLAFDNVAGNLSVNPIDDFTDRTGKAAIIILMASLACTPANTVFGFRKALTVRKSLGLWAFTYAALHLMVYIGLDYALDWNLIIQDALLEKRFIIVGLAALLIMLPLAITSTKGWMRRLGRNWKRLHQLVYAAGVLAVIHFLMLVKADRTEPLIYAVVLSILLLLRVPIIRRQVVNWRRQISERLSGMTQQGQVQTATVPVRSDVIRR
jgi:sulfoxide reductase heme-binding subunit YedZ